MIIPACLFPLTLSMSSTAPQLAPLKPGSYIRSTYVQSLKETRSPYKSLRKGGILELVVSLEKGKITLLPISDFHDSGIEYYLKGDSLAVRSDNQFPEENFVIGHRQPDTFDIATPGPFKGEFRYVGSKDDFLRSHTVAGEYLDTNGRKYVFGVDGNASTPDRKFTFQVGCDHFEAPYDYLYGPDVDWAFEIKGDSLHLFHCNPDGPPGRESKPFLILKRIPK